MLHRRRFLTTTSSGLALGAVALLLGRGALAQPSYTVPLAQLQEMVASKFPRSVPVQGLFDLTLQVPLLRLLPDGRVAVVGGWRSGVAASARMELFDPLAGTWSFQALPQTRRHHAAALLDSGELLVAGAAAMPASMACLAA